MWLREPDSNGRPSAYETDDLPADLSRKKLWRKRKDSNLCAVLPRLSAFEAAPFNRALARFRKTGGETEVRTPVLHCCNHHVSNVRRLTAPASLQKIVAEDQANNLPLMYSAKAALWLVATTRVGSNDLEDIAEPRLDTVLAQVDADLRTVSKDRVVAADSGIAQKFLCVYGVRFSFETARIARNSRCHLNASFLSCFQFSLL
jgi:hypothetical protein